MQLLGTIIHKHSITFTCYADDTQLYVLARQDARHQFKKIETCLKDIRPCMLTNFLLLYYNKTHLIVQGPVGLELVTVDGLTVAPCADLKDLGIIIDFSLSFEAYVDNLTRTGSFLSQKYS